MEIHFQTTDHVVAVEKVVEQHIGTKYSKCNSLRVISQCHKFAVANSPTATLLDEGRVETLLLSPRWRI